MAVNVSPLVSIITPVYTGSPYLEDLILSVLNQNYPSIEHIIIDDGSQDNGATVAILRKFPHLSWWSRANKGQYATMNDGLLAAKGEIICFVSADDIVSPGAVNSVIDFLSRHSDCDGVFGTTGRMSSDGNSIPYYIPFQTAPITFYPYFAHISHCSLYIKRKSLEKYNLLFDPSLSYVGDYDWIIRINRARLKIGLLRRELSRVRLHADQASRKYSGGSQLETQNVIAKHRINKLSFYFLNTTYWFLFKRWRIWQLMKNGELAVLIRHRINKYYSK